MRISLLVLSAFIVHSLPTFAALSTSASAAVSFYRDPQSLFPSGQVSRSTLEGNLTRTELELAYLTLWDQKNYRLKSEQILRDIQVAKEVETKATAHLLNTKHSYSVALKTLPAKSALQVLETDSYWARAKDKSSGKIGWIPLNLLQAKHDDVGVYVNYVDTYLRKDAHYSSPVITTLPRLIRVEALSHKNNFIKISYGEHKGYVDINHFVSKADFANLAYHPKKGWRPIAYRSGTKMIATQGEALPLSEVMGFVTNSHRGIVIQPESDYGPRLKSQVELVKAEANIWGMSKIPGHGEVWWKKTNLLVTEKDSSAKKITTDDLMKRDIYSIAFERKNSVRGIVSSEGIYRTEDGETWELIPQFEKKNYPVTIHPNGIWFVGSFKSSDQGKSFAPFIRWDSIAQAIEDSYHHQPKMMKLTKIETLPDKQIQIQVDTGLNKIKLRSNVAGAHWQVVKTY